jgi:hypothetical protein
MTTNKKAGGKTVTLLHEEAPRKNIPTAERQAVIEQDLDLRLVWRR